MARNPIFVSTIGVPLEPPVKNTPPPPDLDADYDHIQVDDNILNCGPSGTDLTRPLEHIVTKFRKGVVKHVATDGILVTNDENKSEFWSFVDHLLTKLPLVLLSMALLFLNSCSSTHGFAIGVGVNKKTGNVGINISWIPRDITIENVSTGKQPVQ